MYLFITGGVCSSLGKGLTAAALGALLEARGHPVAMLKLDPYLNVDPGTMNPFEHGEVYVTNDGAETDLDLGHYYRFTHSPLSRASSVSSGQIYDAVIQRERQGEYLGKTVQVVPHITDEIQRRIYLCRDQAPNAQVVLVEIGGTAGDIESLPFLEAVRQFVQHHREQSLILHLTYIPYLKAAGEIKTKPTQHSVQALRAIGLSPDLLICRTEKPLPAGVKDKISLFCNVPLDAVIEERDLENSTYELPLALHEEGIDKVICDRLGLKSTPPDLSPWKKLLIPPTRGTVRIGLVGKYLHHQDAYKSVVEALHHAAIASQFALEIIPIEADQPLEGPLKCDGYLVPGGFGERGWEGKVEIARRCREEKRPFFGICLGMQALVTEFARFSGLDGANSTEQDPDTPHPVITLMQDQHHIEALGGSMRLGAFPCTLNAPLTQIYGKSEIHERHRHRYEFNNSYTDTLTAKGLEIAGTYPKGPLVEIVRLPDHPWMIGVQYHPEFRSRPLEPHPLFISFLEASHG